MKVRISSDAEFDIEQAYCFYEKQSRGLGFRFSTEIYSEIESLGWDAGIHSIEYGRHCLLCDRFPFGVFYEIADNEAIVLAVLDLRRDPNWIRRRLS
jgi:hypothetical protein